MKQVSLILLAILLLSFVAEKFVVIRFKEDQVNYHWQNLNAIQQVVNQSSLPHNQVVFIIQSVDSLKKDIQANVTIDSTSKK
jgi:hypothetical protein